jgi:CRP-like cAMP-binding protein
MYELVTNSIQRFGPFSEEQVTAVLGKLKHLVVKKDDCLVKEGQVCQTFYFVSRGSFRHYMLQDDGTEAVLNLYMEEEWVFEYKSFISQQPSVAIIQAAEDSEVFALSGEDFHELVRISNIFFRLGKIFEQAFQNQDYQHNRLSPEEKYAMLLDTKPRLLQKFPLKHIASYLGMTPETLSRVRKKIM